MKQTLAVLLFILPIPGLIYSDNIPTRSAGASAGAKEAIEKLNADAGEWNQRCVVTHSDAEQAWCEEQRAKLETRKAEIRAGGNTYADPEPNPTVEITLRRAGGKIVKQVKTDTNGAFVVGTVPPGPYALEFRAKSAAEVKNKSFVIKIAGTKARVSEKALSGRYFEGGASFVVETLPDIPLRGVIVRASIRNAKKMIWLPKEIGSSFPGRWVEEGSAQTVAGRNWGHYNIDAIRKMQDHNDY
jgi:hypothetical protein